MPKCLQSSIAILMSSAVMQSGKSLHDSMFMVIHMLCISLSLFLSWLCLESKSAMNNCGPDWYRTLYLVLMES